MPAPKLNLTPFSLVVVGVGDEVQDRDFLCSPGIRRGKLVHLVITWILILSQKTWGLESNVAYSTFLLHEAVLQL